MKKEFAEKLVANLNKNVLKRDKERQMNKMKNRDMPVKPIFDNSGFPTASGYFNNTSNDGDLVGTGLTKFEHAVIEFTKAFISKGGLYSDNPTLRARMAVAQARTLFDYMESKDEQV